MDDKKHYLLSCLDFDDGTSSIMSLASGSMEDMQQLAEKIPAVMNSTGKKALESYLAIVDADKWAELRTELVTEEAEEDKSP